MHRICSLIAVILGARRSLKMHSKNTGLELTMASICSVQPKAFGQSSMERTVAENVCSILPSTTLYSKVLQIWSVLAQRASSHVGHLSQLWRWLQSAQLGGCSPTWCLCGKVHCSLPWKSSLLASHFAQGIFSAVSLLVWSVKVLSGIGQHLSTWLRTECPADCWKDLQFLWYLETHWCSL